MCNNIFIGNPQKAFNKTFDGHFSDNQRIIKNFTKSDSFASHYDQHFKPTTSSTDLRECINFQDDIVFDLIEARKSFKKNNFKPCIEECLTIFKNICD